MRAPLWFEYCAQRLRWALFMHEIRRDCRRGEHAWRVSDHGDIRCKFCDEPIDWPEAVRGES